MRPLPRWLLAVLALVVALLVYGIGRLDGSGAERSRAAVGNARAVLAIGPSYRARQVALEHQLAARGDTLRRRDAVITRQGRVVDSLLRAAATRTTPADMGEIGAVARGLGLSPTLDGWRADSATVRHLAQLQWRSHVLLPAVMQQMDSLAAQVQAQAIQIGGLTQGRAWAEARVRDLEGALADLLAVKDCRVLGLLPCPSRTMSFALGVGAGLAAAVVGGLVLP